MIRVFRVTLPALAAVLFLSCEEVINLDLSDVQNQVVIEGILSSSPSSSKISVSLTQSAFEKSEPVALRGAVVTLSDDQGTTEVVKEGPAGVFVPTVITGSPGRSYHLTVAVAGQEYSADSRMPAPMSLDSVRLTTSSSWPKLFGSTVLKYYLTDKPGVEEYCLIKAYNENSSSFIWTIYSDKYSDGKQVILESPTFVPTSSTVIVEVIAVDRAAYDYFYSLRDALPEGLSIPDWLLMTDYNPKSNLTNNALGYFSAQSVMRYTVSVR